MRAVAQPLFRDTRNQVWLPLLALALTGVLASTVTLFPPFFWYLLVVALAVGLATLAWQRPALGLLAIVVLLPLQSVALGWWLTLGAPLDAVRYAGYLNDLVLVMLVLRLILVETPKWGASTRWRWPSWR